MGVPGSILAVLLLYAVATLWVPARWAPCALEAGVFLTATGVLAGKAWRGEAAKVAAIPALLGCLSLWAAVQVAAGWTAAPAETADAVLYWLAAAAAAWLACEVCLDGRRRELFLRTVLVIGAAVCLLGVIQLFTSDGRVFWMFPSPYDAGVIGPFVSRNGYAAFVELLLPVALAMAFHDRRHTTAYLVLAAALVASVIATGSRAGTVLVAIEAALAFLLGRRAARASRRNWMVFAVLVPVFTAIVGYEYVWERLNHDPDALVLRREFLLSSVAMTRAEPLHGFGFGAWPAVYREYALVDAGSTVNHAHNEWVQWAAEGGLPAFAAMLAIALAATRAAFRSIWGLGVLAVLAHSLVDYPFLHLGLAVWTFALLGALAAYGRERHRLERRVVRAPRNAVWMTRCSALVASAVLLCATAVAARTAWADTLAGRGTVDAIARAVALRPDRAEYRAAFAEADRARAIPHLEAALACNPYWTELRVQLASQLELSGDLAASEAVLVEGARRDRQYAPAWALANFYFRTGRAVSFWQWARQAATVAPGHLHPLFELAFALSGDAPAVLDRVVVARPVVEREYLSFLLETKRLSDALPAAERIARHASENDREALFDYVDVAIAAGQTEAAATIWNALCMRHLAPYAPASAGSLVNGDFSQPILNRGFDWRTAETGCALAAQTNTDGAALELFLTGKRPESCDVFQQFVRLAPGARYVLRFEYRTTGLPDPAGLRWALASGADYEFPAASGWTRGEWRWRAQKAADRLVLGCRRARGTTRQDGTVMVRHVRLDLDSPPAMGGA